MKIGFSCLDLRAVVLQNQIDTFLLELMGERFSSHSLLVSVAHHISNKVYGLIRPLHLTGSSVPGADITSIACISRSGTNNPPSTPTENQFEAPVLADSSQNT